MTQAATSPRVLALLVVVAVAGCAPTSGTNSPSTSHNPLHVTMPSTNGTWHTLNQLVQLHDWTVVLFYSDSCPTVKAHDERVTTLAQRYAPKRVGFYWVDSEVDANLPRDKASAAARGYNIPILIDAGARVADGLGARYASHAFILSNHGEVVYSGGIDSDKRFLHVDATPYLARALDAVLSGSPPPAGDVRALGCALNR